MNQAFIDGQNLQYGTVNAKKSWQVDLVRFRVYLERKYKIEKAYYFLGFYMNEHADLYRKIQEAGYILVFRKHVEGMTSIKKGNVDTDIVFEIMRKIVEKEAFDKVVLVSGDGDYFRMVDYLIGKNKFFRLLAPNEENMSSLYRTLPANYYAFLNREDVKKKIKDQKRQQKTGSA